MCCLLIPAAEAIVVSLVMRAIRSRELTDAVPHTDADEKGEFKIPLSRKMKWLSNLLWGGSALLAFEHVWHGEITPWFPFITAAGNPDAMAAMLREMATAGVAMAALVTMVWSVILLVVTKMEKRQALSLPSDIVEANA